MDEDIFGTILEDNKATGLVDKVAAQAQFDRLTKVDMDPVEPVESDDEYQHTGKFKTIVMGQQE